MFKPSPDMLILRMNDHVSYLIPPKLACQTAQLAQWYQKPPSWKLSRMNESSKTHSNEIYQQSHREQESLTRLRFFQPTMTNLLPLTSDFAR